MASEVKEVCIGRTNNNHPPTKMPELQESDYAMIAWFIVITIPFFTIACAIELKDWYQENKSWVNSRIKKYFRKATVSVLQHKKRWKKARRQPELFRQNWRGQFVKKWTHLW